jgi:DnaK suppressor protein
VSDDAIRRDLLAERERTAAQIADLGRQFDAIVASAQFDSVDDEHDPDGATIGFERAQTAALLDGARHHLAEIDRALERLVAGTYGVCEQCADVIAPERLAARLATTTCIRCATRLNG